MTATIDEPRTIDAYAVAFNETDHYFIDREHERYIREIRGVYLFDRNARTHCCELTPSYCLIHLYDQIEYADDTPDDLIDRLDHLYGHCGGDDKYVHCHSVERIISTGDAANVAHLGNPIYRTGRPIPPEEFDYDEVMDSLREHYCGNWPL